jgi:hypothetical protein
VKLLAKAVAIDHSPDLAYLNRIIDNGKDLTKKLLNVIYPIKIEQLAQK